MNNQRDKPGRTYAEQEVFYMVLDAGKAPVERLDLVVLNNSFIICGRV